MPPKKAGRVVQSRFKTASTANNRTLANDTLADVSAIGPAGVGGMRSHSTPMKPPVAAPTKTARKIAAKNLFPDKKKDRKLTKTDCQKREEVIFGRRKLILSMRLLTNAKRLETAPEQMAALADRRADQIKKLNRRNGQLENLVRSKTEDLTMLESSQANKIGQTANAEEKAIKMIVDEATLLQTKTLPKILPVLANHRKMAKMDGCNSSPKVEDHAVAIGDQLDTRNLISEFNNAADYSAKVQKLKMSISELGGTKKNTVVIEKNTTMIVKDRELREFRERLRAAEPHLLNFDSIIDGLKI